MVGIVNVTPDSFSDGGEHADAEAAIAHGLKLVEDGADMLDIGGESTRPGAADVDEAEELRRVIPVIEGLAGRCAVPLSVDTSKPGVMRAAVAAGAGFINDVRALRDEGALDAAAELGRAGVPDAHAGPAAQHAGCAALRGRGRRGAPVPGRARVRLRDGRASTSAGCWSTRASVSARRWSTTWPLLRALPRFVDLAGGLYVGLSRKSMIGALTGRGCTGRARGRFGGRGAGRGAARRPAGAHARCRRHRRCAGGVAGRACRRSGAGTRVPARRAGRTTTEPDAAEPVKHSAPQQGTRKAS